MKSAPETGQGISLTIKCNTVALFRLPLVSNVGQSPIFEQLHKYRTQHDLLASFIEVKNQKQCPKNYLNSKN